jgi:transketolase
MGCGEQQEGSIWEAAMAAGHYKLDTMTAVVDYNKLQIDGKVDEIMGVDSLVDKYKAFRWNVIEINGHDYKALDDAFATARKFTGKPTVIIAHTVKGKGVSFMENLAGWHGKAPKKDEAEKAIAEINK